MQKLLLVCCHSENRATSQIWKVLPNMVFPPIWGEKMASFWACACKLSWTLLSLARVEPLYGAGRKESSGTGLPVVVAGNFALSFSLNFFSIFEHISGSIRPVTLIWASLEKCFPLAQVEYSWCQFWSEEMTSEVEERPRFITASYGRHGSQWVKNYVKCCWKAE